MSNSALIFLVAAFCVSFISAADVTKARAQIYKDGDKNSPAGTVNFEQMGDGKIKVTAAITGLTAGNHGFHVHETGSLDNKCVAAGPHFNPHKMNHGAPNDTDRHVGDLGNMNVDKDNAEAHYETIDSMIAFSGDNNIIGKGFVIHVGEDDLGRGNFNDSKTTGHAGARWGCGIIEEAQNTATTQWLNLGSLLLAVALTVFSR